MTCFRMPNGETMLQYCKRKGLCYQAMYGRMNKGMTPEQAVKIPLKNKYGARYFDTDGKTFRSKLTDAQYQQVLKGLRGKQ